LHDYASFRWSIESWKMAALAACLIWPSRTGPLLKQAVGVAVEAAEGAADEGEEEEEEDSPERCRFPRRSASY
jgi:hypothetical protein